MTAYWTIPAAIKPTSHTTSFSVAALCAFFRFDVPAFVAKYSGASENAIRVQQQHSSSHQNSGKSGTKRTANKKTTSDKSKKAKETK